MSRWLRGPFSWAAVLIWVSACTGGDAPAPGVDVPTFEGTVDLEIGELEGDDPYLFARVFAIATDPAGRILVADGPAHEVRVFAPNGEFRRRGTAGRFWTAAGCGRTVRRRAHPSESRRQC